jgi:hypothetical protein
MSFEGARELPDFPQEKNPEAPMSREVLRLKNSIQSELLIYMIPEDKKIDLDSYPNEWIDKYAHEYRKIFTEILENNPQIMELWEDDKNHEDILAHFQRKLTMRLIK